MVGLVGRCTVLCNNAAAAVLWLLAACLLCAYGHCLLACCNNAVCALCVPSCPMLLCFLVAFVCAMPPSSDGHKQQKRAVCKSGAAQERAPCSVVRERERQPSGALRDGVRQRAGQRRTTVVSALFVAFAPWCDSAVVKENGRTTTIIMMVRRARETRSMGREGGRMVEGCMDVYILASVFACRRRLHV